MSKGPGHIERAIAAAFVAQPQGLFGTDELARICYPGLTWIEKKHRVAVIRAATKVAQRMSWDLLRYTHGYRCLVFYNPSHHTHTEAAHEYYVARERERLELVRAEYKRRRPRNLPTPLNKSAMGEKARHVSPFRIRVG
jgi:hypothetical protein